MRQLYRDRPLLVLCMVLANAALSLWCFNLDPVINNDGVTYINLAQLILDGQWSQTFEIYSWPYYAIFIAATSSITMLNPESAAYLLNTLLATSLTLAFVCIVAELSNHNRRIVLIAALVILFFPSITKYRSFVIRDFGYLSCYLWSLYFIFRFSSTQNKVNLIAWLLFATLSCLFRFEGLAFILITPYFLFLFTASESPYKKWATTLLSIVLGIATTLLAIWYVNDKYAGLIAAANESGKNIQNVFELFLMTTEESIEGKPLTIWSTLSVVFSNLASVFGFRDQLSKRIWLVYVLSNLCMLAAYSVYNNFLVSRYTMASALTLLILSPYVIDRIINGFQNFNVTKKTISIVVILVLTVTSVEGLNVETNKNHIKEAMRTLPYN